MNIIKLSAVFTLVLVSQCALAEGYSGYPGYGSQYPGYGSTNQGNADSYSGYSGNRYQYDMTNPGDRMNYQYDYNAQMRDQYNQLGNLPRQQDQSMGQYGAGIYGR